MKKISGGKNLKGSGTIKYEEEIIMEKRLNRIIHNLSNQKQKIQVKHM